MCNSYGFIYITTNSVNGKKYIGQKTYDSCGKWKEYIGSGIALKNAIRKYGEENFSRIIIEECSSQKELNEREIYWISYYDAVNSKDFYNIATGGDGGNTYAGKSDEELKQISKNKSLAYKGIINQGGNNPNAKKVICLNDMRVFDCCSDAEKYYGLRKESVGRICLKHRTVGDRNGRRLQFEFYEEGKNYSFHEFKREYKTKKVLCIDTNIIYESVKEAQKLLGINSQYITKCCNGNLKSTNGLHFCYV